MLSEEKGDKNISQKRYLKNIDKRMNNVEEENDRQEKEEKKKDEEK